MENIPAHFKNALKITEIFHKGDTLATKSDTKKQCTLWRQIDIIGISRPNSAPWSTKIFWAGFEDEWKAVESWMNGASKQKEAIYIGKMPRRSNLWMADFLLHISHAKKWAFSSHAAA